jgi:hypothetical protein
MKKFSFRIIAVLLAVGFSAFTFTHNKANNKEMKTDYVWHKFNPAGTAELSPVVTFTGTEAGAKSAFGCPDGTTVYCARAYDSEGNPLDIYIRKVAE